MRTLTAIAAAAATAGMLVLAPASAGAHSTSGGLSACDYRASYRDIPCAEVDRAIKVAANEAKVDENRMRQIVRCESKFDPFASNGRYKGLFQQDVNSWAGRVQDFNDHVNPDVSGDIHHPFDNARVSARMLRSSASHWPSC